MSDTQDKGASRLPKADPRLTAIASGKGGVGKTWFAITLAHALARRDDRVLLFDGDLGLANIDIQLGLVPERDLSEALSGRISLREAVTVHREAGFDVLTGRSGSGDMANLPVPRVARMIVDLQTLSQRYDHVVVDVGAGVDRPVQLLTAASGQCLVVVTDEPTSLTDAYALIKVALAQRSDDEVGIVVNMAESRARGETTYETLLKACRAFLKREPPLMGVVRRDGRVRDAIRAQMPLLLRSPNSEAAEDVEAIAARVAAGHASL
jgi:flagellar biosynthesis protein FlhG